MSTELIPSLSSIVDQLSARIEGIEDTGDPAELVALNTAREALVAYALREDRLAALVDEALLTIDREGAA